MAEHPTTLPELFKFYDEHVKLLYSSVQVENQLPAELLFELNAALDHLARHWTHGETEKEAVEKAYSHLKRCCLDVFKLKAKAALDQAKELQGIEISLIDNGEYERELKALVAKIKAGATDARRLEGRVKQANDGSIQAFAAWEPVFADCVTLEKEFYHHPKLNWAKKTGRFRATKKFVGSVIVAALVGAFLKEPLASALGWATNQIWLIVSP
jgi:hypothetical protein